MLFTVLKKEAKQILSDRGFILIAIVQPIIFIIMFGSSFQSGDINHLKTDVIDLDNSLYSNYVVQSTNKSDFFDIVRISNNLNESLERLNKSKIRAVVLIPEGFQEDIDNTSPGTIKLYLDSSNFLTYRTLSGAKVEIVKDTLVNLTLDIVGEVESEKDKEKEKVDNIGDMFKDVEKEGNLLEKDMEELKNEANNFDLEIEKKINSLERKLRSQINNINDSINSMNITTCMPN